MSRYFNPWTDYSFKKLFGEEANKDLLINFLNSLDITEHKIADLSFNITEKLGNTITDRKAVYDLYCIDTSGNRFIVELQKVEQEYFKDRTIYYSSFAIQEQAQKGEWDYKLSGVYCVGILNFTFKDIKESNQYIHNVMLKEIETNEIFYDKLKYIYLEIPKFNKKADELVTNLDKWSYFFKYLSQLEEIPHALSNDMFLKAFNIAEVAKFTKEQMYEYNASLKAYYDLYSSIKTSFDKGEQIGIEKGKAEVVENMLKEGFDIKIISKLTGFSEEEITKLKKDA